MANNTLNPDLLTMPQIAITGIGDYGGRFIDYIKQSGLMPFVSLRKKPIPHNRESLNDHQNDSHLKIYIANLDELHPLPLQDVDQGFDAESASFSICLIKKTRLDKSAIIDRSGLLGYFDSVIVIQSDQGSIIGDYSKTSQFRQIHLCLKSIVEVICEPGLIGIDYGDVRSVLAKSGLCAVGVGESTRPESASIAAARAREHLAQQGVGLQSAAGFLVNFQSGDDTNSLEMDTALNTFFDLPPAISKGDRNIMVGWVPKSKINGCCRIVVVAAGIHLGNSQSPAL